MANQLENSRGGVDITEKLNGINHGIRSQLLQEFDMRIAGQTEAKEAIIDTLLTGIYALKRDGALGAIFLGGPTGVGKTELVKGLAHMLLGNSSGYTSIQGELLKHAGDVSILNGAPPGFIGYSDIPRMADSRIYAPYERAKTDKKLHSVLANNPYNSHNLSIILIDEAEKAHPEILTAFLGAIQNGEIEMNSQGGKNNPYSKVTNLTNTLFIFTSNIGESQIINANGSSIGFIPSQDNRKNDIILWKSHLEKTMPPEFIGRMRKIIRCHPLNLNMAKQVMQISLSKINASLSGYHDGNLTVDMTSDYEDMVLAKYEKNISQSGARPLVHHMDGVSEKLGLAVNHGNDIFGKGFSGGHIIFDADATGNETISLMRYNSRTQAMAVLDSPSRESLAEKVIESVLLENRKMVDTYMRMILNYDTSFYDAVLELEGRLKDRLGFNDDQIHAIRMAKFLEFHETMEEKPSSAYEQITENIGTFHDISIRAIRGIITGLVKQNTQPGVIYEYIHAFMERYPTRPELQFIGYYIHQQELKKHAHSKKYSQ